MKSNLLFYMIAAVLVSALFVACGIAEKAAVDESWNPRDLQGTWRIVSIEGVQAPAGCSMDFDITDKTFHCGTNCNSINGNYTVDGKNIRLTPGMMTRMACPDPTAEESLMRILPRIVRMELKPTGILAFYDASDTVVLQLT